VDTRDTRVVIPPEDESDPGHLQDHAEPDNARCGIVAEIEAMQISRAVCDQTDYSKCDGHAQCEDMGIAHVVTVVWRASGPGTTRARTGRGLSGRSGWQGTSARGGGAVAADDFRDCPSTRAVAATCRAGVPYW